MGKIKKAATERHTATLSPAISEFVTQASSIPLYQLRTKLSEFPQQWPFPRGDLYHWIPLLDRFDHVLELFNKEYGLDQGPQSQPFERRLLERGDAEDGMLYPSEGADHKELEAQGFAFDGDRELVESIVDFTRILLEHCGNRSLYASSGHLNDLLHTTSLSLLRLCLKLALRLAQRYQVARYKNNSPHAQAVLLANHYSFDLDNLHKMAMPFPKPAVSLSSLIPAASGKGKEKSTQSLAFNPSDLVLIAKEPRTLASKSDLTTIVMSYYDQSAPSPRPATAQEPTEASPSTPTPTRRTSNLGPGRDRPSAGERSASTNDVSSTSTFVKIRELDNSSSTAPKIFQIASAKVLKTPEWLVLREALPNIPTELRYDLLNRVRIAKALGSPETASQQLLEVRLLAIANLAYALSESKFQEKVGIPDAEEPRSFHLSQQLCDLLQPPTDGQSALSLETETTVLMSIEALAKSRHKSSEIADALSITVNHGVLYYELRKVIATLNVEEYSDKMLELHEIEWREAVFDLINTLQQSNTQARYGERMVAAGIMEILAEALSLHTSRAERFHEKILQFFASFIHNIPTAFQTLATIKGLDIIAELTQHEVQSALQNVKTGKGLSKSFKSKVVDYDIPFYQQSTLRQLFKFTVHMFDHNAGTHDRLLRNLIDTPQILGALRSVIENAPIFGSNVWSGAVNIMSSFIHNEPTSYQVIGEAGLSRSFLESITGEKLPEHAPDNVLLTEEDLPDDVPVKDGEIDYPTVDGLLPVGETMCDVPSAFGAICLNEAGMKIFQSSKVLLKFFDIFVSPAHVKALEEDGGQTAATIGHAFDELCRHHPQLKEQILMVVTAMVKRVSALCRKIAEYKAVGAKLWESSPTGPTYLSGGHKALMGASAADYDKARDGGLPFTPTFDTVYVNSIDLEEEERERALALPFLSACIKFLEGFFHNSGMCQEFCLMGGADYLLDLATSPSNPHDFASFPVYNRLAQVLKTMCESKAHLVLPSLIRRTQNALCGLKPIMESTRSGGVFAEFADFNAKPDEQTPLPAGLDGTTVVKSLAQAHMLSDILGRTLAPPHYSNRQGSQVNQLFTTLNFTDVYVQLVDDLSKLHAACIWEHLALQEVMPQSVREKSDPKPFVLRRLDVNGFVELATDSRSSENQVNVANLNTSTNVRQKGDLNDEAFAIKNAKALRFVLSHVPSAIESFFRSLGQALVPKRSNDFATKQHASLVAEHLARSAISELEYRKFKDADDAMEFKYIRHAISAVTHMMLRNSFSVETYQQKEALTLVLNKFYVAGGLDKLNEWLVKFKEAFTASPTQDKSPKEQAARDGLTTILDFYNNIVRSKSITDAVQSKLISVRDHKQADYFVPGQFVVEIRDAVLPAIEGMWYSDAIDTLDVDYVQSVIGILRVVLKGEGEDHAIRREENASRRVQTTSPQFCLKNTAGVSRLQAHGIAIDLSCEAVYRTNNHEPHATEYANLRRLRLEAPRFQIPSGEPNSPSGQQQPALTSVATTSTSTTQSDLQSHRSIEMTDAADQGEELASGPGATTDATNIPSSEADMMSDEDEEGTAAGLLSGLHERDLMGVIGGDRLQEIMNIDSSNGSIGRSAAPPSKDTKKAFVTVEDLNDKRVKLRDELIDRCLDILSAVPSVTFEIADLIQAAVATSGEGANPRAEIGRTLVSSLLSLQVEESSKESGDKIAAYAHLVALVLQERDFFDSTLDELKEYFDTLVGWVQLAPEQKAEDAPWIEMVLLIIERVLAEDEQPVGLDWTPPPIDDPLKSLPTPKLPEPVVSSDSRSKLLDALIDILPRVGRNSSLALSVTRVLVILTRRRELAVRLSEKYSMSRLFLMIRQMPGAVDEKLQSAFMLVLRHMVEDEQIVRQIMQTEIRAAFEGHRSARAMDTTTYTRNMYHLVLRDPELFVDVTQEMLEISRFDGNPLRAQSLALKKDKPALTVEDDKAGASAQLGAEASGSEVQKPAEAKAPTVETTDGVVSFLLRELSNYKDVEDRPALPTKETQSHSVDADGTVSTSGDVAMVDAATPTLNVVGPTSDASKNETPAFKAEDHSIYIYRCFILRCLSELLASYTRTKVEFINFSRRPETNPATPSKPRAGTLNYLLNTLIPVGTLEHKADEMHHKRTATSIWATGVLVSLVTRTQERYLRFDPSTDDEPNLAFVRRFVLEHAIRSFREAITSTEPLDHRYSRLLGLGELFNRMLSNKMDRSSPSQAGHSSGQQIGKLMYEKNFIGALTSAIAELDLNFPNAKRAVKYILAPLKQLTELGVNLSQTSHLSSSPLGTSTEEGEISSATSVSDDDQEEREHTPDLLRNTTLGIFENPGNDEESESDSEGDEDEDMYDEGFDEEMEYEEEPEHGDVISDEDEDIDGIGNVEGVPGDVDMDVEIVMDGPEGDSEDDEEEDLDDDDEDEDDDDDEDENDDEDFDDDGMDEITGDGEGASLGGHDEEGVWEEAVGGNHFGNHAMIGNGGSPHGGPLGHFTHALGADGDERSDHDDQHGVVHIEMGDGEEYFEDEMPDGEDDEEDEVDYDNDVVYEPELEEEDEDDQVANWDWHVGAPPPPAALGPPHSHFHNRHQIMPRGLNDMFGMLSGDLPPPTFRTHRPAASNRAEDDGMNPLLQREGSLHNNSNNRDRDNNADTLLSRLSRRAFGLPLPHRQPGDNFVREFVAAIGQGGNGTLNVSLDAGSRMAPVIGFQGGHGGHALIDIEGGRPWRDQFPLPLTNWPPQNHWGTTGSNDVRLVPTPTIVRWQEEARMLFGGKHHEKATRVITTLLSNLVPPAMEAKRQADLAKAEREAEEAKAREEERQRIEAEKVEREAREKKEREEREAMEAEAAAGREHEARMTEAESIGAGGLELSGLNGPVTGGASASTSRVDEAPLERITTTIRGRELDITSLGIDLEYIEALPEEIREEVIMSQFQEQRTQAAQAGEQPSEISREFLDALPRDIQTELLRQEAQDRRRRERDEARRNAAQVDNGPPAQPEEMNNADFMAMLDPALRRTILMDTDENILATLPEHMQAEARTLLGDRIPPVGGAGGGIIRRAVADGNGVRVVNAHEERVNHAREDSRQRRPFVQMLEKPGVATLLRLMFVSLHHKAKTNLHSVLSDVCKNTQNRAEVISILLSILQDGTADVGAVERSFAQLSLKAKQLNGTKTPQPLRRAVNGEQTFASSTEVSPLNIVQHCLATLNALTLDNPRVPSFFLSEHETMSSQKIKAHKKSKSKESKAPKFPINALLALLDRKLITENTGVMEMLASLLSRVTHPLTLLMRRAREARQAEVDRTPDGQEQTQSSTVDVAMTEASAEPSADAAESSASEPKPTSDSTELGKSSDKRKHRELCPPDIPDENIRLVVNILAARECPSKTFSDTLDIIKNLSAIPNAKEVFGRELVRQAQALGQDVLSDLADLAKQITSAESGTDLQGMALASFSNSGSKQRKLTRVLLALDHLFDPKRIPHTPASQSPVEPKLKEDVLGALYDSSTFEKLWSNLSLCLAAIRRRGSMVNIATILLPLIESFMVVCRNTALKEPTSAISTSLEVAVSSPAPESRMESLFFQFTEDNRKILNELIRNNPKLMSGHLSILAKNSKVLEFDNKRTYFSRKLHHRGEGRQSHPSLQLSVRRDQVFLDSFKYLYYKTGDEIKYGKLNIRFHGEEGIDAGGVSREWFAAMARQMFKPDYALFNPVASDRTTFHPNPLSEINPEHFVFFKFIGRIIGKALYEGRVLDCHFSRAVYRRILGKSVSLKDMESLDLDYYKSLVWILENDITDVTFETFSVEFDRFGAPETIDLIENGRNIPVTEENKQEYVRLMVEYRLIKSVEQQLDNFLTGFHEIIPPELVAIFNEQELELLISGLPDIDVDDWKNNTEYHNYQSTSPQIQWFWRAVRSFDKEEKAKLLQFVTGTSKVPLNGFKELEGMNGFAKFNIHRDYSSKEKLPSSHTCFNQLDLPEYESYEHLRHQLYTAITAGSEYFGFA